APNNAAPNNAAPNNAAPNNVTPNNAAQNNAAPNNAAPNNAEIQKTRKQIVEAYVDILDPQLKNLNIKGNELFQICRKIELLITRGVKPENIPNKVQGIINRTVSPDLAKHIILSEEQFKKATSLTSNQISQIIAQKGAVNVKIGKLKSIDLEPKLFKHLATLLEGLKKAS
ncbi:hypothetical protein KGV52_00965, partial [Candidatus Gracilibacteria bacterium]|nr:hypothetical protein [Candidatus Gracilibacteria bacterium]